MPTNQEQLQAAYHRWQGQASEHITTALRQHIEKSKIWEGKGIDISAIEYTQIEKFALVIVRMITEGRSFMAPKLDEQQDEERETDE